MRKAEKIELLKDIEKKKKSLYKKIDKLNNLKESIIVSCNNCKHQLIDIHRPWNNDPYTGGYHEENKYYSCSIKLKNDDRLCYRFKKGEPIIKDHGEGYIY